MRVENERDHRRLILKALAERTGIVTLVPNVGETIITDARIRNDSPIILVPTTPSAAAEIGTGTVYIGEASRRNGSVVVLHANTAQNDRSFRYLIG